jgi:hypothetical protein
MTFRTSKKSADVTFLSVVRKMTTTPPMTHAELKAKLRKEREAKRAAKPAPVKKK